MLTKYQKSFTFLFILIVCFELACTSIVSLKPVHYFSKPLILTALIVFFVFEGKALSNRVKSLMLTALLFSLLGDILLMFVDLSPYYFIGGLLAFLCAHITYVILFLGKRNKQSKPNGYIIILLIYASSLFYLLYHHLGDMLIPVVVYVFAILLMAITAALRKGLVSKISYTFVLIGALLFVISDSVLAINKFHTAFNASGIIIMLTYALAQYCIVMGVLKQND